jgi:hypothetical protein
MEFNFAEILLKTSFQKITEGVPIQFDAPTIQISTTDNR